MIPAICMQIKGKQFQREIKKISEIKINQLIIKKKLKYLFINTLDFFF
jgi:hypothetical protein